MNPSTAAALDRTLLLMRDDVHADDAALLGALTQVNVALVADAANLASHSAQTAYVTAATLMARAGHRVWLCAPDIKLVGPQPPLRNGGLIGGLVELGMDLIPGVGFAVGPAGRPVDLEVRFGDSKPASRSARSLALAADAWSASIFEGSALRWADVVWPFGGLAAGVIAAEEAFKAAMWRLAPNARNPGLFAAQFAPIPTLRFELAPPGTPTSSNLGAFDCVSAGAIMHSSLYSLARIPDVYGRPRILDDDVGEVSNLNRNALMRRSDVGQRKATALASAVSAVMDVTVIVQRYAPGLLDLAPAVLIGVDDIAARWDVQRARPAWLGVGATSHWAAMASFHYGDLACAGCLHPTNSADTAPIPTVAFVSFWAGLLLAAYFARKAAGDHLPRSAQHTFLTGMRPDKTWRAPVAVHPRCPVGVDD